MNAGTSADTALDEEIAAAEAQVREAQARLADLESRRAAASGSGAAGVAAAAAKPATAAPAATSTIPAPCYTAPTYVPAKDHIAAGLLAVVLGCFGIHKFYLGYTTAGFIMLAITIIGGVLTFGIAAALMIIIGVVEGVIYLCMSQSEFEETHVNHIREWF